MSQFGKQLRSYRKQRGMSQLDLAHAANSTPRYISFIETGRSRPGKEIVLRIAKALSLTLRNSNSLLVAAGLSAAFNEAPLNEESMSPVKRIIDQVLQNHNPYPAWAIGPGLRFLDSNAAAENIFPGMVGMESKALIDMWCAPSIPEMETVRRETVFHTLNVLRQEMFHYPHPDLPALLKHIENYAKVLEPVPVQDASPIMCSKVMIANQEVRTLATIMRFDKVFNVTMAEIRLELVFPADNESEKIFRNIYKEKPYHEKVSDI